MDLTFIRKASFVLSLLAAATFAHAGVNSNVIPCPSISTIQETALKIDAAEMYDGTYIVYTSTPAFQESNLPWYVGVATNLSSADEAIKKGQATVQNINTKVNQDAVDHGNGTYSCVYQPGYVVAIGGDLNPVSLFKRH